MHNKNSGFTLLEIIAVIVVGGIVAAVMVPFMSTALTRSHEPLENLDHAANLSSVMAKITGEYRKDSPEDIESLKNFRDSVTGIVGSDAAVDTNKLIEFVQNNGSYMESDCDQNAPSGACVLKVGLRSNVHSGETLTALFGYAQVGSDNGNGGLEGTEFNFATMDQVQISDFIHDVAIYPTDDPHQDRWGSTGDANSYESRVTGNVVLGNTSTVGGDGQKLFLPIPDECDDYVVRAVARTTAGSGGHGYGIYFDTVLGLNNDADPGFRFMFDRGLGEKGALQLRSVNAATNWHKILTNSDDPKIPEPRSDPWWTDLHYIRLYVSNSDGQRNVQASVFDLEPTNYYTDPDYMENFTDFYFGPWEHRLTFSETYIFSPVGKNLHTGIRTWGSHSFFHYLDTQMMCSVNGNDGIVLCVGEEPTEYLGYEDNIDADIECAANQILVLTSAVGLQSSQHFNYIAPGGIYIESGVNLASPDSGHGSIILESENGDITLEEGVIFSTESNSGGDREEIHIKAGGNIDIRGVNIEARINIYLEAGGNIYAQRSQLTTERSGANTGIRFDAGGTIYIEDTCAEHAKNSEVRIINGVTDGERDSSCKPIPS